MKGVFFTASTIVAWFNIRISLILANPTWETTRHSVPETSMLAFGLRLQTDIALYSPFIPHSIILSERPSYTLGSHRLVVFHSLSRYSCTSSTQENGVISLPGASTMLPAWRVRWYCADDPVALWFTGCSIFPGDVSHLSLYVCSNQETVRSTARLHLSLVRVHSQSLRPDASSNTAPTIEFG